MTLLTSTANDGSSIQHGCFYCKSTKIRNGREWSGEVKGFTAFSIRCDASFLLDFPYFCDCVEIRRCMMSFVYFNRLAMSTRFANISSRACSERSPVLLT